MLDSESMSQIDLDCSSAVPNQAPGLWSSDSKGKRSTSCSSVKRGRRGSLESWTGDSNEEDSNNDDAPTVCTNCRATSPVPLWRRDPGGRPLCRECGLYHVRLQISLFRIRC